MGVSCSPYGITNMESMTCGSCGHGRYPTAGDNGTVACQHKPSRSVRGLVQSKQAKACDHWIPFKAGPKEAPTHV